VRPLGFSLDDKQLRRAGLDYREHASVQVYDNFEELMLRLAPARCWALTTRAYRRYTDASFSENDLLLFGPETRGLPQTMLDQLGGQRCLRIPMLPDSRSLNLSNAAALVIYEGLRQLGFGPLA
jgi:tRNA (cytidine/uridine-2'-O-)-methyltransferase